MSNSTDISEFIGELDAGIFAEKLSAEISQMAMAVVEHGRAAKLVISLDMKQIGHHHQVNIAHKMVATRPTLRGKKTEEDVTETPLHVGKGGKLTIFPENQMDLIPTDKDRSKA